MYGVCNLEAGYHTQAKSSVLLVPVSKAENSVGTVQSDSLVRLSFMHATFDALVEAGSIDH